MGTYAVGEVVQVCSIDTVLSRNREFGSLAFPPEMDRYCGKNLTICYVDSMGDYQMAEVTGGWFFNDSMLVEVDSGEEGVVFDDSYWDMM